MSYTFTTNNTKKVLVVTYSGEVNIAERERAVLEGVPVASKAGYTRLLIDLRGAELLSCSAEEESHFATMLSTDEYVRRCKITFVVRKDQHDNDFIVMRASAKHLKGKQFTDMDAAYQWLTEM